jgi:SH3-like domain-containing protein
MIQRRRSIQLGLFPRWLCASAPAIVAALVGLLNFGVVADVASAADTSIEGLQRGATGLAVPRFVSLKGDRVNLRKGPGTDYPTAWVYGRAGLPVEILKEFDGWRQIRDADGVVGWVQGALLSGRRTALVAPWDRQVVDPTRPTFVLRDAKRADGGAVAYLEPGVIVVVADCDMAWCKVTADGIRGYVEQAKLWGVYPGEKVN